MSLPLKERITSIEGLRSWKDQIPFHYEYTAGLAGERFLRGLQAGKILAAECSKCGKRYVPPKVYCVDCYLEINRYREVGPEGVVAAVAHSSVGFGGERLAKPKTFLFVAFKGVTGGIIHTASVPGLKIGTKVLPVFKPQGKRKGTLLDVEGFVKA